MRSMTALMLALGLAGPAAAQINVDPGTGGPPEVAPSSTYGGGSFYTDPAIDTDTFFVLAPDGTFVPVTVGDDVEADVAVDGGFDEAGAPSLAAGVVNEPPAPVEAEPLRSLAPETAVRVAEAGAEGAGAAADGNRVAEFLAGQDGERADPAPGAPELRHLDEAGRAALAESLTAYYRYRTTGFEHRRAVFDWQLLSSKIIFVAVILLVTIGVYFSWLQFMAEHRRHPAPAPAAPEPEGEAAPAGPIARAVTTLEATASGIKVSSPVLGVVILMISLAFFYLYLVHVYPVNEVF